VNQKHLARPVQPESQTNGFCTGMLYGKAIRNYRHNSMTSFKVALKQ